MKILDISCKFTFCISGKCDSTTCTTLAACMTDPTSASCTTTYGATTTLPSILAGVWNSCLLIFNTIFQGNVTVQLAWLFQPVWQIQHLRLVLQPMEEQLLYLLLLVKIIFYSIWLVKHSIIRCLWKLSNLHFSYCMYDRSCLYRLHRQFWWGIISTSCSCRFDLSLHVHFALEWTFSHYNKTVLALKIPTKF